MCYHSQAREAMRVSLCNQPHSPSCRGSKCLFPVRSPRFVTRQSAYPGWRTLRCRSWLLPSVRVRLALSRQVKSYFVKRIHLGECCKSGGGFEAHYLSLEIDPRKITLVWGYTAAPKTSPTRKLLVVSQSRCTVTTLISQLFRCLL